MPSRDFIGIYIFLFGVCREHCFVAGIGYELMIIQNIISRIITINIINIIVSGGGAGFMLGDGGFLDTIPFGTYLISAPPPPGDIGKWFTNSPHQTSRLVMALWVYKNSSHYFLCRFCWQPYNQIASCVIMLLMCFINMVARLLL
jgi:hypothetical protein